ncbi:MAG: N-acetylmuramate/N-acetylglucosamine kinase [Paracidovorax wautersii]|uniref:N-acetylmuramate/N-acetylglucosamine kinase n=1 Tax=Paracidovorax wautersii TaxID=1177982 RepID=A0A7V8FRN9_9BURK|nr:MAG: N-acetylmuramate/N-acetylglucosamine kinase [Paracidovorax wautersii]
MPSTAVTWADAQRQQAFDTWLRTIAPLHGLHPPSVRLASADASFRRYLRVDATMEPASATAVPGAHETSQNGPAGARPAASFVIMDAPPAQEDSAPFVQVAALMAQAGLKVPRILDWDQAHGFLLLDDLGSQTLLELIAQQAAKPLGLAPRPAPSAAVHAHLLQSLDTLVAWQQASRPGVLPDYDEAMLRRELNLYPDEWYIARHKGLVLSDAQQAVLQNAFTLIVRDNLAAPRVYVHRDFMPRNLMVPGAADPRVGVLDFQDAVYGPVTYDIASLMRDAFLSWDEEVVIDITIRYWEKARKAGLLDHADWASDFGAFYRSVEWMGLQRHLKVAGIFARLTLRDGKPKYLADTPRFTQYIRHTASRYIELKPLMRLIDQIEGTALTEAVSFGRL